MKPCGFACAAAQIAAFLHPVPKSCCIVALYLSAAFSWGAGSSACSECPPRPAPTRLSQLRPTRPLQLLCPGRLDQPTPTPSFLQSYAPYSKCPAGAAIITAEGEVYSGPYLESAAYNPSLPPLQTAIIDAVIDGMPCYTEVSLWEERALA